MTISSGRNPVGPDLRRQLAKDGQIERLREIDEDRGLARREEMPFAAEPVGPQFGPEELFHLLGALGFTRCR
jgi:hypothetical protein